MANKTLYALLVKYLIFSKNSEFLQIEIFAQLFHCNSFRTKLHMHKIFACICCIQNINIELSFSNILTRKITNKNQTKNRKK